MPDILDGFKTKKGKKEWNKLSDDAKAKVIETAIVQKTSGVMAKEIAKGIITGTEMEQERIYNNFVSKIDACVIDSAEWLDEIDKLLSYIRMKHVHYISKNQKKENGDE